MECGKCPFALSLAPRTCLQMSEEEAASPKKRKAQAEATGSSSSASESGVAGVPTDDGLAWDLGRMRYDFGGWDLYNEHCFVDPRAHGGSHVSHVSPGANKLLRSVVSFESHGICTRSICSLGT